MLRPTPAPIAIAFLLPTLTCSILYLGLQAEHVCAVAGILVLLDLQMVGCSEIEDWAQINEIPVLGRVPFSTQIAESIADAQIPGVNSEIREMLFPLWENIIEQLTTV